MLYFLKKCFRFIFFSVILCISIEGVSLILTMGKILRYYVIKDFKWVKNDVMQVFILCVEYCKFYIDLK